MKPVPPKVEPKLAMSYPSNPSTLPPSKSAEEFEREIKQKDTRYRAALRLIIRLHDHVRPYDDSYTEEDAEAAVTIEADRGTE